MTPAFPGSHRIPLAFLLALAVVGCEEGAPATDTMHDSLSTVRAIGDSIQRLEQQWADAIRTRDAAVLERLVASNFVLAGSDTTLPAVPRDQWMGNTLERLVVDSIRLSPAEVEVRGDTAIARLHFVWAGTFNGALTFHDSTMLTDHWVRGPAGWQVQRRTTAD